MTRKRLYSTGEAGKRLRVQRYRLHYLLDTGQLQEPAARVGGKRIWTDAEISEAAVLVARLQLPADQEKGGGNGPK